MNDEFRSNLPEWETLDKEIVNLSRLRKFDRAVDLIRGFLNRPLAPSILHLAVRRLEDIEWASLEASVDLASPNSVLDEIDAFLIHAVQLRTRGEAMLARGTVNENRGLLADAAADFAAVRELLSSVAFTKYVATIALAKILHTLGSPDAFATQIQGVHEALDGDLAIPYSETLRTAMRYADTQELPQMQRADLMTAIRRVLLHYDNTFDVENLHDPAAAIDVVAHREQ